MPRRLFHYYQRTRIVNINANIIMAGLIAIALSKGVLHVVEALVPKGTAVFFTGVAVVCDMVFNVVTYYALHWVANHWKPLKPRTRKDVRHHRKKPPPFFKDATLVQFERILLSPLYYLVAASLMYGLQKYAEIRPGWALAMAFPAGLVLTRCIHTWYGLKTGRFEDHGGFGSSETKVDKTEAPVQSSPDDSQAQESTSRPTAEVSK